MGWNGVGMGRVGPHGDEPTGRACGGSPPHERLRSRNSRHLQCCPFWCPRGTSAARYYPRGTGGGAGGGLRAIFWWVTVYFSGSVLLLELVASKLQARFSQISAFAIVFRTILAPASVQASCWRSSAQQCSQLEQQGRHLFSRATLNGHLGNFVFLINEISSP
jgi:hypothetical protein